jgi:hypothetical protein
MSERKNIDKLFQEKFENFEIQPPEMVWKNIKKELEDKEDRKIIPFWWKIAGIAAIFMIGFFVKNSFSTINNINEKVVIQEKKTFNSEKAKNSEKEFDSNISSKKSINVITSQQEITETEKKSSSELISDTENRKSKKALLSENYSKEKNRSKEKTNKSSIKNNLTPEKNNAFAVKNVEEINTSQKNSFEQNIENKTIIKDVEDVLASKKTDSVKKDLLPNKLEEILKEKETKNLAETKIQKRWEILSNIAPVYFGSTSEGSPIDPKFSSNNKSYNVNLSYGLGVNYNLNKRFSIKSGINKVTLDYNTNDIVFYADLKNVSLKNITANNNGSKIRVENKSANTTSDDFSGKNEGYINQKISYLEFPLEMSYKLFKGKFNVKINGGLSTLLVNENSVSVVSSNRNMLLGEANNLNKIHFSTNIGLGFKYNIYKSIDINLDPMFKYQLNTFSNDSGGFKPFAFGFYSGVSYSF